jgi:hypothetical protein
MGIPRENYAGFARVRDFILVASKTDDPSDYSPSPADKILLSFFDGGKNEEPDVKKLAQLLRDDDVRLAVGFPAVLAEILDSRLPHRLACNWQLKPVWTGRYDEEVLLDRISAEERKRGDVSRIAEDHSMHGMCKSKFYTNVRPKIKARREKRKQDLDRLRRQARAMEAWRRHCLLHENSKIME